MQIRHPYLLRQWHQSGDAFYVIQPLPHAHTPPSLFVARANCPLIFAEHSHPQYQLQRTHIAAQPESPAHPTYLPSSEYDDAQHP